MLVAFLFEEFVEEIERKRGEFVKLLGLYDEPSEIDIILKKQLQSHWNRLPAPNNTFSREFSVDSSSASRSLSNGVDFFIVRALMLGADNSSYKLLKFEMIPGIRDSIISSTFERVLRDLIEIEIVVNNCSNLDDGDVILTHCNAGSLATVDYGTALGVIRAARDQGKRIRVIATETRPKLQGARLTTYELMNEGVPVTLITDNMVGYIMYKQLVQKVIVGADRIVRDAVINKIGTYLIAVSAKEHNIPFYVAAPNSTFDVESKAADVTIEERRGEEVTHFYSYRTAPEGVNTINPAFDITPLEYVTAIICEDAILGKNEFSNLQAEV